MYLHNTLVCAELLGLQCSLQCCFCSGDEACSLQQPANCQHAKGMACNGAVCACHETSMAAKSGAFLQ